MSVSFDFDKIQQAIDKATTAIEKLDASLVNASKDSNVFNKLFGSTATFDRFITSVKKLDEASTRSFGNIATGITQIGTALDSLKTSGATLNDLLGSAANFDKFVTSIQKLDTVGAQSFSNVADGLKTIAGSLDKVNTNDVAFGSLLKNVNQLVTSASTLGNLNNTPSIDPFIKGVIDPLSAAANRLQGIGSIQQLGRGLGGISQFVNAIGSIDVSKINTDRLSRFSSIARFLDNSTITTLGRSISVFSRSLQDIEIPPNIGVTFTGISRFVNAVNNANVPTFNPTLLGQLPVIGRFFQNSNLQIIGRGIKQFAESFQGVEVPENLGASFNGIGDFIRSINKTNLGDINNTVLSRLGGVFNGIQEIFSPNKFQKVAIALKQFVQVFDGIEIPDFSKFFEPILLFVKELPNIDFTKIDLSGFNQFMSQLADGLSRLNKVNVDTEKLQSIGTVLKSLQGVTGFGGGGAPSSGESIFNSAAGEFLADVAFQALQKVEGFISRLVSLRSEIASSLENIGHSLENFGNQIQRAGQAIIGTFGIQNLANNPLVQAAGNVDRLSTSIKTLGNLSDTELKSIQDFSFQVGTKFPQSADAAQTAILSLIRSGETLSSTKFIIPSAAALSEVASSVTGTPVDLTETTQALVVATNVFNNYAKGVKATFDNVGVAANAFNGALQESDSSLSDLIAGFQAVGTSANGAGLDLTSVLAILTEFKRAGIDGATAGAQLKQVLNSLITPQAQDELAYLQSLTVKAGKEIDLSTANADGSLKDLNTIVKNLNSAYKELGFTQSQELDSLSKIANSRARQGLQILLSNDGYDDMVKKIQAVDDVQDTANKLNDTFSEVLSEVQTAAQNLGVKGFLPLLHDSFTPFLEIAKQVLDALTQLPDSFFKTAANVVLFASSLATVVGGVLLAVAAVTKFEGALFILGGNILKLLSPAGLLGLSSSIGGFVVSAVTLVAAIGAIIVVVGTAGVIFAEFRNVVEQNIGGAGDAFNRFRYAITYSISLIGPLLSQIGRVIGLIFGDTAQAEISSFGGRVAGFFNTLGKLSTQFNRSVEQIGAAFQVFGDFIQAGFGGTSQQQIQSVNHELAELAGLPLIKQIFGSNANVEGLRNVFTLLEKGFGRVASSVDDILSGSIGVLFGEPGALDKVNTGLSLLLATITRTLSKITGVDLSSTILDFDQGKIGKGIEDFFKLVLNKVRDFFVSNRHQISDIIGTVLEGAVTTATGFISFIARILGLDNAGNIIDSLGQSIGDIVHRAINIGTSLISGDTSIDVSGFFTRLFSGVNIRASLESVVQRIFSIITTLLEGNNLVTGINNIANGIKNAIVTALGLVPKLLESIGSSLHLDVLTNFGVTLQNSSAFQQISTALGNIAGFPLKAMGDVFSGLQSLFEAAASNPPKALTALAGALAPIAIPAVTTALSGLFGILSTFFSAAVLPAFGILTLVTALGNLHELLQGNVGKFLIDTLSDLASTLLSFFGVNLSRDDIITRVGQALVAAGDTLPALFAAISDKIKQALDAIGSTISLSLDQIFVNLRIGAGANSKFVDAFNGAQDALSNPQIGIPGGKPTGLFNFLGDSALGDDVVHQFAVTNSEKIIQELDNVLSANGGDESRIPDALFGGIARALKQGNLVQQAIDSITPGPIRDAFISRIFSFSSGQDTTSGIIKQGTDAIAQQLSAALTAAFQSGTVDLSVAQQRDDFFKKFFSDPSLANLTKEQIRAIISQGFSDAGISGIVSSGLIDPIANAISSVGAGGAHSPIADSLQQALTNAIQSGSVDPASTSAISAFVKNFFSDPQFANVTQQQVDDIVRQALNPNDEVLDDATKKLIDGVIANIAAQKPVVDVPVEIKITPIGDVVSGFSHAFQDILHAAELKVGAAGGQTSTSLSDVMAGMSPAQQAAFQAAQANGGTTMQFSDPGHPTQTTTVTHQQQAINNAIAQGMAAQSQSLSDSDVLDEVQQNSQGAYDHPIYPRDSSQSSIDQILIAIRRSDDAFKASNGGNESTEQYQQIVAQVLQQFKDAITPEDTKYILSVLFGGSATSQFAKDWVDQLYQNIQADIANTPLTVSPNVTVAPTSVDLGALQNQISHGVGFGFSQGATAPQGRANGGELASRSTYQVHDTPSPEIAMFNDGTSLLFTGQAAGRMVKIVGRSSAPAADATGIGQSVGAALTDYLASGGFSSIIANSFQAGLANAVADLGSASLDKPTYSGDAGVGDTNTSLDADRKAQEKAQSDSAQKQVETLKREISDYEETFFTDQYFDLKKYNEEALAADVQYNHDRVNLIDNSRYDLAEAIRKGDGASAAQISRSAKQQLSDLQFNYVQQKTQRDQQFQDDQQKNQIERAQRENDYKVQLADLIQSNKDQADAQSTADDQSEDDQNALNRNLQDQQATGNHKIEDFFGGMLDFLATAVQNNTSISNAFIGLMNGIGQTVGAAINPILSGIASVGAAIQSGGGSIGGIVGQPIVHPVGGGIGSIGGPVGAPINPYPLMQYRDASGQWWIWTGSNWQKASVVTQGAPVGGGGQQQQAISGSSNIRIQNIGTPQIAPVQNSSGRSSGSTQTNVNVTIGDILSNATDPLEVAMHVRSIVLPEIREEARKAADRNRTPTFLEI